MASRDKVSFHRLSRDEYVNTIEDLLGVHFDASDPGGFTEDPEYHGFERIGSILSLSASHVEKYFQAAEIILKEAYPEKEPKPVALEKMAVDPKRYPENNSSDSRRTGWNTFVSTCGRRISFATPARDVSRFREFTK